MSPTLVAAASSSSRGEINIQPAYFTSSLFVEPFREDVDFLAKSYKAGYEHAKSSPNFQPFTLFKNVWSTYGWNFLHLKVLEPRGRESYTSVISRLFLEQATSETSVLDRVVGLFGLYTFWASQPSGSVPPVRCVTHTPVPIDLYQILLRLPQQLNGGFDALIPYVDYVLNVLLRERLFIILPEKSFGPETPRNLPREVYYADTQEAMEAGPGAKKSGRPSKQDLVRKARSAVSSLDKWVDRSTYPLPDCLSDPAGAPSGVRALYNQTNTSSPSSGQSGVESINTTHILLSQRPMMTLEAYRAKKEDLLNTINADGGGSLIRASEKVVLRLQQIDAMAAERGLEVGTEGGDLSGLGRVQKASEQFQGEQKGLLGLLEGSGLQ
ncbi:hypothetical protein SCHPADRAFT_898012 [Schizopora paradoxa]|uniref:Uncharacterized protein n=1 Tax=Schizopora paradoxa TaxID=27342 RepID=A0A0H2SA73_9AGAM|nr:hypothetical protein SCHPADRAFT_898012 [Schizopora paradoxa]